MSKTIKRFFASLWMTNSRNLSFFGQALNNTSERSEESQYRAIGTVSYLRYLSAPPAFDHPSTVEEFPSKLCQENNYHAKEFIKQPVTEVLSPVLGSVEIYCGLAFVYPAGETTYRNKKSPKIILERFFCRGDRIRTCDPLVPNQMRYQLRYTPNNGYCQKTALYH